MADLKIAVDAHAIGQRQTGNEVYVRSLIHSYPLLAPDADFISYVSCDQASQWIPESFEQRRVAKNPFVRLGAELSSNLRQDRPDLLHVQYTAPLNCPCPIVVTVHDVSYMERPEYLPKWRALQLRLSTTLTLRRAAKVVTISEFSRQQISKVFNIDPDEIAVTPLASQQQFRVLNREMAIGAVRAKLGFDRPFVLNVGDLHPRKNQVGLIRAFAELIKAHPELPHLLVFAGKRTWFTPKVTDEIRRCGLEQRVLLTDFVDDDFLPLLYNAADLFVFPSFYEGFGLPAIEAMACGRAVVCSSASALPEVVDGAALLFEPDSTAEQMRAMRDILIDPELAGRMERLGLQRAKVFDWRETARQTLDVYYEVAEARARQRQPVLVAR